MLIHCDLIALSQDQSNDPDMKSFIPHLKSYPLGDKDLYCDTSMPYPRPFEPSKSRESIFYSLHDVTRPSIKSTLKLIKARYFWPDMDRQIRQMCQECSSCQQAKVHRHIKSPVHEFQLPSN